ncbi:MAG: hypothetical protein PQJ60_06190, partial [Spirochaetales bacterium]|nr:hypothetical protein [Spirochaetales bacterium]
QVYTYNSQGSMIGYAELGGDEEPEWIESTYGYDDSGELISRTSPLGLTTTIEYDYTNDDYDLVTTTEKDVPNEQRVNGDRTSSVQIHKLFGWVLEDTQADGTVTSYERDDMGRITRVIKPREEDESDAPEINVVYDDDDMTVKQIDSLGNYTVYSFNNRGEIEGIEKFDGEGNSLQDTAIYQDFYGNISQVITPGGDSLNFTYDGLGRVLTESYTEDGESRTVTYEYDGDNSRMIGTDERGNSQITYTDGGGRTTEVYDVSAENYVVRMTGSYYNIRGELLAQQDGNGNLTEYYYDRQGNVIESLSPEANFYEDGETSQTGNLVSLKEYNGLGQVTNETVELLVNSTYSTVSEKDYLYDTLGRLKTEKIYYYDKDETEQIAESDYYYDSMDRVVLTEDPRGNEWAKSYTARGQLATETNPLGAVISYEYDLKDRMTSLTDSRENSGSYEDYSGTLIYHYDDLDRLIKGELPTRPGEESRNISFNYDKEGNLLSRIEPDGGATVYTYTEQNRVKTETRQDSYDSPGTSYTSSYAYDEVGNLSQVTYPDGVTESYEYDAVNRKVSEDLPEDVSRSYAYDDNDNLIKSVNGRGFEQTYEYDNLNRLILFTDETEEEWTTGYNGQGNVTRTVDPNGVVRKTLYDERGSILREYDGRGLERNYSYDGMGNLVTMNDARGTEISYTYREDNLPTEVVYINGDESRTLSYSYDEEGALVSASDNGITTTYNTYDGVYVPDALGQITRRTTTGYNDVYYSYDNMDRMVGLTNDSHATVSYSYNGLGQLEEIGGYMSDLNYDSRGRLEGYTLGNGLTMSRSYDDRSRLDQLSYTFDGVSLKDYQYGWDKADNLVEESGNVYAYDARDRLSLAMFSEGMDSADAVEVDLDDYDNEDYFSKAEEDVLGDGELVAVDPDDSED